MARRKRYVLPGIEVAEDTRPLGSVFFGDPSKNGFTERVHTFNPEDFHSPHVCGEHGGVRSGPTLNSPAWQSMHEKEQYRAMNRRKGVLEDHED